MRLRADAGFSLLRLMVWLTLIVAAVLLLVRGLLPALEKRALTAQLHENLQREVLQREEELERIRVRLRALRDRDRLAVIRALVEQGWSREGYRLVKPATSDEDQSPASTDTPPKRR